MTDPPSRFDVRHRDTATARRWPVDPVLVAAIGVFAILRFVAVVREPGARAADSAGYDVLDFTGGHLRPWTVPLVYRIVSSDGPRVIAQTLIGVVSWSVLAIMLAATLHRRWVGRAAAVVTLALGLTHVVVNWDTMVLSESIGLSLTVLLVAVWIWWLHTTKVAAGVAVVAVTVLWTFVRTDHLYVEWILAAIACVVAVRPAHRREWGVLGGCLVVIALWGQVTYSANRTLSDFNVADDIAARVLPNTSRTAWFTDHGMPVPRGMVPGHPVPLVDGLPGGEVLQRDEEFARWVHRDGLRVYGLYLATHPGYTLTEPLADFVGTSRTGATDVSMLAPNQDYGAVRTVMVPPLEELLLGPGDVAPLFVGLAVVAVGCAMRWRRRGFDRRWSLPVVILVVDVLMLWVIWHAAPGEPARHALEVAVTARIAVVALGAVALDPGGAELVTDRTDGRTDVREDVSS